MNKIILYILLTLIGSFGIALKFSQSHEKMPIGCDEFGYLNLAKSFRGEAISYHEEKTYLKPLLDTLRKSSITENEISWMITPHAYHVLPNTDKIINQYPPGTSLILSIFPIHFRQLVFPFLSIFLICILTLIVTIKSIQKKFTFLDIAFPALIFIMMVSAPFTTELSRINSLAPTFGLLFAAGMVISKNPLVATLLIALSLNFRIANAVMLIPVLSFIPFKNLLITGNFKNNLILLVKFGSISIVASLPLLIYNYVIMGNPFSTTYSSIDQAYQSGTEIYNHVKFYFNLNQLWFRVHILCIAFLLFFTFSGKIGFGQLLSISSFALLNYTFFIFHEVKMDYYPYASAMILLGYIGSILLSINLNKQYDVYYKVFFISSTITIFTVGCVRFFTKPHQTFDESKQNYSALCQYDIVWGDLFSGTTEYVCNNNGFRYGTTTPRARKIAVSFLKSHNYRQAILLDDNTIPEETVLKEIEQMGLKYTISSYPATGKILTIE